MTRSNDKSKIVEHYETVSQYYKSLWGNHIHHGYWVPLAGLFSSDVGIAFQAMLEPVEFG